ncbi:hypothetical protein D3C72_2389350 [compost metagenome]
MSLVDQNKVDRAQLLDLIPNRLNATEQHLRPTVTTIEAGGINASRRKWAEAQELLEVLFDQ